MRILVLGAAALLALGGSASAADRSFDLIGTNGRSSVFIDLNSKTINLSVNTFWTLTVGATNNTGPLSKAHYFVSKISINCTAKTVQTLEMVAYGPADELVGSWTTPTTVVDINPGSLMDIEYKYVCLSMRPYSTFKLLSHVKEAVAYADNIKPPSDAPGPND